MDKLQMARYRFTLQVGEQGLELPVWKAATFRGALGYGMKGIACSQSKICDSCQEPMFCAYSYLFETRSDDEEVFMGKYEQVPRPYILELPVDRQRDYEKGDLFSFDLLLFGRAIHYAPLFVTTFQELGKVGLGRKNSPYQLLHVESRDPFQGKHCTVFAEGREMVHQPIIVKGQNLLSAQVKKEGARQVMVYFETPLRLKWKGHYTTSPDFHVLIRNVLRRLSGLLEFHHGEQVELPIREMISQAETVKIVSKNVKWVDYDRYSSRQEARMKMGGFTGYAVYEGEGLDQLMPILKLAEWVHVGKNTAFGLGQVRVVVLS